MYITLRLRLLEGDAGGNSGGGTPQAGGTSSTSPQAGTTTPPTPQAGGGTKTSDDYERMIADLRKENAAARVKAKELDDLKAKLEADKLSETEKLQKQIADAVKERDTALATANALKLDTTIQLRASHLNFADPDDAIKLLDRSKVADDGSNVDALLKDLLNSKPHLKAQGKSSSGGATNPGRQQSANGATITPEFVRNVLDKEPGVYATLSQAQKQQFIEIASKMGRR
jgi:hypothetical protein